MNKLVSIIIPNYNCEKYVLRCLNSVIRQEYKNKEIIIIDDGSNDKSIEIIKEYINDHKKEKINLICQNNLNAAIARNKGLELAKGDYVLFLDSDDELEENMLENTIKLLKNNEVDLLIGNYTDIDEAGETIRSKNFFDKKEIIKGEKIFKSLSQLGPVPSNKIYRMDVIKKNNLSWGNVRIGQDLNFYLKYILCCNKVLTIPSKMYKYRIINNSMSRKYNYNIFDIVNSFEDVKKFYKSKKAYNIYEKYIQVLELIHYNLQMSKAKNFKTKQEKLLVMNYFSINEKKINYRKCENYDKKSKKLRLKFKIKVLLKQVYISKFLKAIKK